MDRAVARAGMHDALGAGGNRGLGHHAVIIGVRVDDVNAGELLDLGDIELARLGVTLGASTEESGLVRIHHAQCAEDRCMERVDVRRVHLGHVAGTVDLVIENDEHALAGSFLGSGNLDGVQEVERAVSGNGRCGTHGANEHHGLVALDGEVQEIGRLFERVRAVRDHDAVHIAAGEQFIDALGELELNVARHVCRVDVADLFAGNVGVLLHGGHCIDQRLDADRAGLVASHLSVRSCRTGNRAARGENRDIGQGSHGGASERERSAHGSRQKKLFHLISDP